MTDDIRQIVIGSLLGHGRLEKDYFYMKHPIAEIEWLKAKANELNDLTDTFQEKGESVIWKSKPHPLFSELYKEFYPLGKKKVTMDWLNQLRDIGVAIWYGDSGMASGRGKNNACLKTQALGEDNKIIEQFFNEVNIPCRINKSRNSYVIIFTKEGTNKLYHMIANCLSSQHILKLIPIF